MATKVAKKKTTKASASPASKAAEKQSSPAAKPAAASSVIPFNPLSSIANSNLCNFNQSVPNLNGAFESMESMMTNYKDQYETATAAVQQNIEACIKTSTTFAKGAEQLIKTVSELAQESTQRNSEAVKSLMATRTLNEFAEAQNKLAQSNFDEAMSAATKLSEMTIKLYTEAFEPINGQMTKAMKKVSESMAA